jgi:predicted O-linked N-acetylglucosamine transferase (SPINDLY family)
VLQTAGLYEAAIEHFDKAAELNPQLMEVYNNKATLLHTLHRHFEALTTLDKALAVNPTDQKSLHNKGYILTEYKQHKIAADIFSHLLALNPDYEYAEGLRALARLHSCDWTGFEENKQRILQGLAEGKRVCNPFAVMAITDDLKAHQQCAEIFGEHRFPQAKELLWKGEIYRHRKKRVAFISADFREHPVGYLLVGMLEKLDKSQFELVGISLGIRDESSLYKRYRNLFDHYLDYREKPSIEIAQVMRAMEIDIAIDLSGYTAGSRLEILSYRPAPVQITYLGFPGGLSVPYIDYLIADRGTVPEELQAGYKEKILYLPHCYLPRDTGVRPAPTTIAKSEFGLPEDAVVLCSFNHDYKINPPVFEEWMKLLSETPKSVLWLMKLNEAAQQNLQASANHYGIDPSRLIFAERVPKIEDHLARYRHVDLFLDTYPYNGHTTTSDALLVGTPVVTLSGTGFQSRVARSLLTDCGKNENATLNLSDYASRARAILKESHSGAALTQTRREIEWPITEQQQADALAAALNAAVPLQ